MEYLFDKLKETRDSGIYPYHMPGHKRQTCGKLSRDLCGFDVTEIDGFDNLHQSRELLLELQQKAAALYGAEESFYLVNGSTAGILSAISAALPRCGRILIARNCHKSAYHAIYLRKLSVSYLYPPLIDGWDVVDAVMPQQVNTALESEPETGAVLIVSPTYEGRISDVRTIAEIVHERGIPLIVDEAHGAHLGFSRGFAENSCQAGADLVVHSVHKTLPALTQAALLHVNGSLIDRSYLRRFLQIYQTSSPSYLLMASIDNALRFVEQEGGNAFQRFEKYYGEMVESLAACRSLRILPSASGKQDIGKLVISIKGTGLSGQELYDILRTRYGLQLEMASESYALAMFTVGDTPEGYERMTRALLELDSELSAAAKGVFRETVAPSYGELLSGADTDSISFAKAWDMEKLMLPLDESSGCCAGEFVNLYPPGVPILVPGEHITALLCEKIRDWVRSGLDVQGVEIRDGGIFITVLREGSNSV